MVAASCPVAMAPSCATTVASRQPSASAPRMSRRAPGAVPRPRLLRGRARPGGGGQADALGLERGGDLGAQHPAHAPLLAGPGLALHADRGGVGTEVLDPEH